MKKTKLFVFDVNTFVSAFLVGSNNNTIAFRKALDIGYIISTQIILDELTDVFIRKKFDRYLTLEERIKILSYLDKQIIKCPLPVEVVTACRDPKDDKFLELAIAANASAIITGDKDLLVLHPFQNIPIVSPADFLQLF